jgi:hypothetical protein
MFVGKSIGQKTLCIVTLRLYYFYIWDVQLTGLGADDGSGRRGREGAGRHNGVAGDRPGGGPALLQRQVGGALLHPVVLARPQRVEGTQQRLQPTQVSKHLRNNRYILYMINYIKCKYTGAFVSALLFRDQCSKL